MRYEGTTRSPEAQHSHTITQHETEETCGRSHLQRGSEVASPWCREPVNQSDPGDPEHHRLLPPSGEHAEESPSIYGSPRTAAGRMHVAGLQIVYDRCAGCDVHKKSVVVHVVIPSHSETRTFGTTTRELLSLLDWLAGSQITHVAMESTGVYWKRLYSAPGKACAQGRRCFSETEQSSPAGANPVRSKPNQQTGSESCVVHG